jgi:hypothetical protein
VSVKDLTDIFQRKIDQIVETDYLTAQLTTDLTRAASKYHSALLYEAGVFASFEHWHDSRGGTRSSTGPMMTMDVLFGTIFKFVQIILTATLLCGYLWNAISDDPTSGLSLALVGLNICPMLLAGFRAYFQRQAKDDERILQLRDVNKEMFALKAMGKNGEGKQEVVLYGLKDWVLRRWRAVRARRNEIRDIRLQSQWVDVCTRVGRGAISMAFNVSCPVAPRRVPDPARSYWHCM